MINPLLTKLVRSRWLDIGREFMGPDSVSVHKHAKLGQYPAILTEQDWAIIRIQYTINASEHLITCSYDGQGGVSQGRVTGLEQCSSVVLFTRHN